MVIRNKQSKIILVTGLFLAATLVSALPQATSAYAPNCVSAACHAAADKEAAAQRRAAEASQSANDVAGMVAALDAELSAKEAEISAKQTLADDLAVKVSNATEQLDRDQEALAKLLVEMHFHKKPSTISLIASANTLGDFSNAQSRQESIKDKITSTAKQVAEEKRQLEQDKFSVDAILAEMNNQKSQLATQRAERSATVAKYQSDVAAAKAEANAASKKVAAEIAAEIARYNSGGQTGGGGGNTYPWRGVCPAADSTFSTPWGYVCQCTSYAGFKANERWGNLPSTYWGNATSWSASARARGYRVDWSPAPGTIAVSHSGVYGHVMWVESVNANGTINLSEYNNYGSSLSHLPGDYGTRVNVPASMYEYIHFGS